MRGPYLATSIFATAHLVERGRGGVMSACCAAESGTGMKIPPCTFPIPCDEGERKACLDSLAILDSPSESQFDRITGLVLSVFSVPIALVSLVDSERQ